MQVSNAGELGNVEMQKRRPVMLAVLDGWGWREEAADNAIRQARTPSFDRLWATCPHAFLHTSGEDVGLPSGQMGNSEVGHLNIGAGRLVLQDLPRINAAIAGGDIARAPALKRLIEPLQQTGGSCHVMGLVSPGGVHSHQDHAAVLAGILAAASVPTLLHAFTDGRDTPPRSAGEGNGLVLPAPPPIHPSPALCGPDFALAVDEASEPRAPALHPRCCTHSGAL